MTLMVVLSRLGEGMRSLDSILGLARNLFSRFIKKPIKVARGLCRLPLEAGAVKLLELALGVLLCEQCGDRPGVRGYLPLRELEPGIELTDPVRHVHRNMTAGLIFG